MVYLLSEIHGLPVWSSLLSRARRGSAEEGRDDNKYPIREGEMRMNRNPAIEIPVVSAFMSWRKRRIQGERIPKQSRYFRDELGVACLLSEGN